MKKQVTLLICSLCSLCLVYSAALGEDEQMVKVGKEKASEIAASFVGEKHAANMSYDKLLLRGEFPPFVMCHGFKIPLGPWPLPQDVKSDSEIIRTEMAGLLVEECSGRVVYYGSNFSYPRLVKYKDREIPTLDELLPESRIVEISKEALKRANVSMDGLRLDSVRLEPPLRDEHYYGYCVSWVKYTNIEAGVDVQLPFLVMIDIDALSGEVDKFFLKEYPVVIDLVPPKITKETAEKLALANADLEDDARILDIRFKVDFDPSDTPARDDESEFELFRNDRPKFCRDIVMKRQVLVWLVTMSGHYKPPDVNPIPELARPKGEIIQILKINAITGKVIK